MKGNIEDGEGDKNSYEDVDPAKPIDMEEDNRFLSTFDEGEESSVEQVELTIPTTDDPRMPTFTFRMWVLGVFSCVVLTFQNQIFWYRTKPLSIIAILAQSAVLPLGRIMAATLSKREFSMNPEPFNIKEHVIITIFANSGVVNVCDIHIVSTVMIFYNEKLDLFIAFLIILTTQILGFG